MINLFGYKFALYPNKTQEELLNKHLGECGWLYNKAIEQNEYYKADSNIEEAQKKFELLPDKNSDEAKVLRGNISKDNYVYRTLVKKKKSEINVQIRKAVVLRPAETIRNLAKVKKKGLSVGRLKFIPIREWDVLPFKQSDQIRLEENYLILEPYGRLKFKMHRPLLGKPKTFCIKRTATDRWTISFSTEYDDSNMRKNDGGQVGIDVGLKTHLRLSNENPDEDPRYPNPKIWKRYDRRLTILQRRISKSKKLGKNRTRLRLRLSRLWEKIRNSRADLIQNETYEILSENKLIAIEDLNVKGMQEKKDKKGRKGRTRAQEKGLHRSISDAAFSEFRRVLEYKAKRFGSEVKPVSAIDSSKECHNCGNKKGMPLESRIYECPKCGLKIDRDLNSAKVILARATGVRPGSNARADTKISATAGASVQTEGTVSEDFRQQMETSDQKPMQGEGSKEPPMNPEHKSSGRGSKHVNIGCKNKVGLYNEDENSRSTEKQIMDENRSTTEDMVEIGALHSPVLTT